MTPKKKKLQGYFKVDGDGKFDRNFVGFNGKTKKKKLLKEPKCDCCGWDDYGYTHEPNCSLRIWQEKQEEKKKLPEKIEGKIKIRKTKFGTRTEMKFEKLWKKIDVVKDYELHFWQSEDGKITKAYLELKKSTN